MLYAYFDDSGTHEGSSAVTMAGYVANVKGWEEFEKSTEHLFEKEKVTVFRAKKFFHGEDDFAGWTDDHKLRFARAWYEIARSHMICGVTISVNRADFKAMKQVHTCSYT